MMLASHNVARARNSSVMVEKSEQSLIEAARDGDELALRELFESTSRELRVYAYRMLGGFQDAEDALQEARLKAWRSLASYEPRASFRAWMYRIVTNTCLDMLRTRRRRVLPQDVGPPVEPGPPSIEMRLDIPWLEPYPDALLPHSADPEAALLVKESIRLAFVRAMQVLPPRQRAALILHDVLDWSTSDVATMLETSDAAINSALQRARGTMARSNAGAGRRSDREEKEAEAVSHFVRAWETGDLDLLVSMLAEDAVMSMPPWVGWLQGREAVAATLRNPATWDGEPRPGRYRLLPTEMNGQPAALAYMRGDDDRYVPVCLTVLTVDQEGRISALTVFVLAEQFIAWGYPSALEALPIARS
jgi:RNA polymerase sigma-70 factor (ECF subfamily)